LAKETPTSAVTKDTPVVSIEIEEVTSRERGVD
jgi:hypothetical protein